MLDLKRTIRVLPIHIINPQMTKERSVHIGEEFESLITTFGGEIVARLMQKIEKPDNGTYIGRGKVVEVTKIVKDKEIDLVIVNALAKPGQIHNLKKAFQEVNPRIEVWDRVDLILQIFDKHATTIEAKLQIELARMRYMGPRIYGMGFELSRQGGGIGTLGIGETNSELMRRHWRKEMKRVNDELANLAKSRETQVNRRKKEGFLTVSIVGYTNAGKSSLFNLLTKKNVLVENALFATLDTTVGKIYLPKLEKEILITDTIGFIRNLPPKLIEAFKSTLMESTHADLVLHVIDISDPEASMKIHVVTGILKELEIDMKNVVFVFNKIDQTPTIDKEEIEIKYKDYSPIFISVKKEEGIDGLFAEIVSRLSKEKDN